MEEPNNGMANLTTGRTDPVETKTATSEKQQEAAKKGNKKDYLSRGNLIAIGLSSLFSFLMIFAGICISDPNGGASIVSVKNPLAIMRDALGFEKIEAKVPGQAANILVAVYITLFLFAVIFEYRYAVINHKKWYAPKQWLIYLGTFILCAALSYGLGFVIQTPLDLESLRKMSVFIGECALISLLIYLLVGLLVAAVLLAVVNFIKFGKPFANSMDSLEETVESNNDIRDGLGDVTGEFNPAAGDIAGGIGLGGEGGSGAIPTEKLADRDIVFPALSAIDRHYEGEAVAGLEGDDITLADLCSKFRNFLAKTEQLYYDIDVLRFFVSGLAASHLEILEGLSGTGKSSLPRSFAKYVSGAAIFLPVQATWRDKSSLIGYFNDFSKTYRETDFLLNLYEANYNPDRIYMFVLDEMNISRVEYYFADFLSVLEYPEEQWKIRVLQLPYDFVPPVMLDKGFVTIPNNAYFVGTANQDDSTFSIADKVYDRAITIAFDDRNPAFVPDSDEKPIFLTASKLHALIKEAQENNANAFTANDLKKFAIITDYVRDEFGVAFGNRILNQIENIVPVFVACGGKKEAALDFMLSRKVLAKLEGRFEDNVKSGLEHILALLDDTYGDNGFPRSRAHVETMLKRL